MVAAAREDRGCRVVNRKLPIPRFVGMRGADNPPPMGSPSLAALISSLISQILIIIFLFFPPSTAVAIATDPNPSPPPHESLLPLLRHFLAAADIAAALSLPRKRKRADDGASRRGRVARSPDSFRQFFRMKAATFEWLSGLLEPLLDCRDPVGSPLGLPADARLGIGLFRLATGAGHREIAARFGVSEADSRFCVKQLCRVLCTNYRFWVGFPSAAELEAVSTQFETLAGLPNCCGVVTCARFQIDGGGAANRKESVAAQIVVDSSSRILSIAAGFRGGRGDFEILKSSNLCKDIEEGKILNSKMAVNINNVDVPQYLVGNGEYPLLPWLLVPFENPEAGSTEENLNAVLSSIRGSSSRAMTSLRKWGVLERPIKEEYKAAVACIGACSILHNMLIMREDYSAFCNEFDDRDFVVPNAGNSEGKSTDEKAFAVRNALARRLGDLR